MKTPNFDAVLFDCDGVLVDSETITNGVLRAMLAELGWELGSAECMRIFLGKAVKDERALIEAHTGRPLTEDWLTRFRERRNAALMHGVQPIRNAVACVAQVIAISAARSPALRVPIGSRSNCSSTSAR